MLCCEWLFGLALFCFVYIVLAEDLKTFTLLGNSQLPIQRSDSFYKRRVSNSTKKIRLFTPVKPRKKSIIRQVSIVVFSVWVGEHELNVSTLNHKIYCDLYGYDYRHFYYNSSDEKFPARRNGKPIYGWASAMALRTLLDTSKADYFFKFDLDCVFIQSAVRLESLLDPYEQYSLYISTVNSEDNLHFRFSSSHTWIARNSAFTRAFLDDWWQYHDANTCDDMAMEQGGYTFAIGDMISKHYKAFSPFECSSKCYTKRTFYLHYMCVLGWLEDNFGPGQNILHPDIFVYRYVEGKRVSPDDGYSFNIPDKTSLSSGLLMFNQSLTAHPCKRALHSSIETALNDCLTL